MSVDTASPRQQVKTSPTPHQAKPYTAIINAPSAIGRIGFVCTDQGISQIKFLPAATALKTPAASHPQVGLAQDLSTALQHYFKDAKTTLTIPLAATGTDFQRRVWQAISAIPLGETRSYGQLANALNSSARAIGGACRANPLPLLVPCHRVISASGQLGGFLGQTAPQGMALNIKQWLLRHETTTPIEHAQPY